MYRLPLTHCLLLSRARTGSAPTWHKSADPGVAPLPGAPDGLATSLRFFLIFSWTRPSACPQHRTGCLPLDNCAPSLSDLCRDLCRNPAIPTRVVWSRIVSLDSECGAGNSGQTGTNTSSTCRLPSLAVARRFLRQRTVTAEVAGSSPVVPAIFYKSFRTEHRKLQAQATRSESATPCSQYWSIRVPMSSNSGWSFDVAGAYWLVAAMAASMRSMISLTRAGVPPILVSPRPGRISTAPALRDAKSASSTRPSSSG